MSENDLDAIRSRYLGVDKKKRKIRKMNDKKFVFDWDEQEDTNRLATGLGEVVGMRGAAVMFGRGHLAGMEGAGGHERGEALNSTGAVTAGERHSRADERHWSEKALNEMKERDWRIFREDFSIAARGWKRTLLEKYSTDCRICQVVTYLSRCGHGKSPSYLPLSWMLLRKSGTRNRHPFRDKPFQSDCRIATSLALPRLVRAFMALGMTAC